MTTPLVTKLLRCMEALEPLLNNVSTMVDEKLEPEGGASKYSSSTVRSQSTVAYDEMRAFRRDAAPLLEAISPNMTRTVGFVKKICELVVRGLKIETVRYECFENDDSLKDIMKASRQLESVGDAEVAVDNADLPQCWRVTGQDRTKDPWKKDAHDAYDEAVTDLENRGEVFG